MSEQNSVTPEGAPSVVPARSRISNTTLLNIVLFVGLIVLYVLHFVPMGSPASTVDKEEFAEITEKLADGAFNIAFVKSDSLLANYKLAINMRADFDAEQQRLDNDLQRRQRNFQTAVEQFQRQIQSGAISMENAQVKEQELMQTQQEIIQLNDTYTNQLMMKELEMNTELYGKIKSMLERFNEELGYDYILGYSPGGGILYAKETHDITEMVIQRLNQEVE